MEFKTTDEDKPKPVKKRPGRPRKNPKKDPIEVKGVVDSPQDDRNAIELFYHNPNNLKKIIQFLHQESVAELIVMFNHNEMIWISNDSSSKSKIKLTVNGAKVNKYFCKIPQEFKLLFDDLKILGDKLDSSSYNSITIMVLNVKARPKIHFMLETSINIQEYTSIVVDNPEYVKEKFTVSDKLFDKHKDITIYPLRFRFPHGKYLKKMILDIKNSGKTWEIYKFGDQPLEFKYNSENNRVDERRVVRSPELLNVVSHISSEKIFSTSVFVEHIKPLTSLLTASDGITIYCSESSPLIFEISIENGAFMLLVTANIVDFLNVPRS